MEQYLIHAGTMFNKRISALYDDLAIGEAFMRYREELFHAGFKIEKDMSKLRIFNKVAQKIGDRRALKALPKLTYQEFYELAYPKLTDERKEEAEARVEFGYQSLKVDGRVIVTREKIMKTLAAGGTVSVFAFRDEKEEKATRVFVNRMRSGKVNWKVLMKGAEEGREEGEEACD